MGPAIEAKSGTLDAEIIAHTVDKSDAEANARLIAAAPEMLTALEEIQKHLYTDQDLARCRGIADDLIAKLTP